MDIRETFEGISESIVFNDVDTLTRIMEETLGLDPNSDDVAFLKSDGRIMVAYIISFAAASAYRKNLTDEMALRIIHYVASSVSIFSLCRSITFATNCTLKSSDYVSSYLRNAVREDVFDDRIRDEIKNLSVAEFKDFLAFIVNCDDIKEISHKYAEPIYTYIYQHKMIPVELFFALMSGSLTLSFEERLLGNAVIVPVALS